MPDDTPIEPDTQLAAAVDPSAPGLPRGRTGLPAEEVQRRQRERLVRGAVAAIAAKGYAAVTVADIVAAARVSRKAFYEHFRDREDCFLAAAGDGGLAMVRRMAAASAGEIARLPVDAQLRRAVRTYLAQCATEPEFTVCLFQELPVTGTPGRLIHLTWFSQLAQVLRAWHRTLLDDHGSDEPLPPAWVHRAAIGAAHELLLHKLESSSPREFPAMEDQLVTVFDRMLNLPPADDAT